MANLSKQRKEGGTKTKHTKKAKTIRNYKTLRKQDGKSFSAMSGSGNKWTCMPWGNLSLCGNFIMQINYQLATRKCACVCRRVCHGESKCMWQRAYIYGSETYVSNNYQLATRKCAEGLCNNVVHVKRKSFVCVILDWVKDGFFTSLSWQKSTAKKLHRRLVK